MAKSASSINHQQQLQKALKIFQNYFYNLYSIYSFYFKLAIIIILIYFSYKLGKKSLHQPIDNQVKKLSKDIKGYKNLLITLPQDFQRLKNIKKISLILSVIITIGLCFLTYTSPIGQIQIFWIAFIGISLCIFIGVGIWSIILTKKQKSLKNNNKQRIEQTKALIDTLGNKTNICRDVIQRQSRIRSTQCDKKQCQQMRGYYRLKAQGIKRFVQTVINFQWCSICKVKKPFDELLSFTAGVFKNQSQDQQIIAKAQLQFLLKGLQEMINWIKNASPCNCSQLYWESSTKQRLIYQQVLDRTNGFFDKMEKSKKSGKI